MKKILLGAIFIVVVILMRNVIVGSQSTPWMYGYPSQKEQYIPSAPQRPGMSHIMRQQNLAEGEEQEMYVGSKAPKKSRFANLRKRAGKLTRPIRKQKNRIPQAPEPLSMEFDY